MCLSPTKVPNPNRNILSKNSKYDYVTDDSAFLYVPCGMCATCLALKQSYFVQRVQMESLDNVILFGTLTYNTASMSSLNVNGYKIRYANTKDFQNFILYLRKYTDLPPFRYFACSEFGKHKHRPHWHYMLFYPKDKVQLLDCFGRPTVTGLWDLQTKYFPIFLEQWRKNYGSRKVPDWRPLCTFKQQGKRRNFDLQFVDTVTGDISDAAFYVTKYSTKFDDYVDRLKSAIRLNSDPDDFTEIWNTVKPRYLMSKGFGNVFSDKVFQHIRKGIELSIQDKSCFYPIFISPYTGQHFPLAPYFRKKFLHHSEALIFKERILSLSPTANISDSEFPTELSPQEVKQKIDRFDKVKYLISSRDEDTLDLMYGFDDTYSLDSFLLTDKDYGTIKKLASEIEIPADDW